MSSPVPADLLSRCRCPTQRSKSWGPERVKAVLTATHGVWLSVGTAPGTTPKPRSAPWVRGGLCCGQRASESGRSIQAYSFSFRSFSLQSYYQNLLADHQAGVGVRALSCSLSRVFLGSQIGCSGFSPGETVRKGRIWVPHLGLQATERGPFIPLSGKFLKKKYSLSFPFTLLEREFRSADSKLCLTKQNHTGKLDTEAEEGDGV